MSASPVSTALTLRQRMSWEALDAGVLLWRTNLRALLAVFALPVIAFAVILRLAIPDLVWISWVALWWFKPLYDRLILYPIANSFFQKSGGGKTVERKRLFSGLLGDLAWRRFSFMRSVRMPVRMLEGIKRKQLRGRFSALSRGGLDFGWLLTILCLGIELLMLASIAVFGLAVISSFNPDYLDALGSKTEEIELLLFCGFCVNLIIIEGLYAAMGFAVYINARVEVEGWDIQFLFRNFAASRPDRTLSTGKAASAMKMVFLALLLSAGPFSREIYSQDAADYRIIELPDDLPAQQLEEVLASEDFGGTKERWALRLKKEPEPGEDPEPQTPPDWERIRIVFGYLLLSLLIMTAAGLLIYFTVTVIGNLQRRKGNRPEKEAGIFSRNDVSMSGRELLSLARKYLSEEKYREGWSCCVRAAILRFAAETESESRQTELEILKAAHARNIVGLTEFSALIQRWLGIAYAGKAADGESLDGYIAWCEGLMNAAEGTGNG